MSEQQSLRLRSVLHLRGVGKLWSEFYLGDVFMRIVCSTFRDPDPPPPPARFQRDACKF